MSRLATRLLAVLVPSVLLVPAAAHAEQAVFDDASGDVKAPNLVTIFGDDDEAPLFVDTPAETSTDIVRTTVDHASKRLTLTVQFRDLVDTTDHSVQFPILTPRARYVLNVVAVGDRTEAQLDLVRFIGKGTYHSNRDPLQPCRAVRARYDVAADTLTASAPTACLGAQKWVQVGVLANRFKITPLEDGSVNLAGFVDDGFRGGMGANSLGRSPKVRRG